MAWGSPATALWGGTRQGLGREAVVPAGTLLVPWTSTGLVRPSNFGQSFQPFHFDSDENHNMVGGRE